MTLNETASLSAPSKQPYHHSNQVMFLETKLQQDCRISFAQATRLVAQARTSLQQNARIEQITDRRVLRRARQIHRRRLLFYQNVGRQPRRVQVAPIEAAAGW